MSFEYTHRIPIVLNNILAFLIILELTIVLLQLGIVKQVELRCWWIYYWDAVTGQQENLWHSIFANRWVWVLSFPPCTHTHSSVSIAHPPPIHLHNGTCGWMLRNYFPFFNFSLYCNLNRYRSSRLTRPEPASLSQCAPDNPNRICMNKQATRPTLANEICKHNEHLATALLVSIYLYPLQSIVYLPYLFL
jgi:hypothetical protein